MNKKSLVIVESPAKARTMSRMLKGDYIVKATMGHVRDLPEKELGVDVENHFSPKYVVPRSKNKAIKEIKTAAKDVSTIYLATDPDREGEAISWHIVKAAKLEDLPLKRVTFHEITAEAIKDALKHPAQIDMKLVDAQQTRRILDRLVGYKISPILWRKVRKGLSAGRVQSVATRMIVEREREIEAFVSTEYWSIDADLKKISDKKKFRATLVGSGQTKKIAIENAGQADDIVAQLSDARYSVAKVTKKSTQRQPVAPFITSTLQQEAWRKLRYSAKRTMSVAQTLYEGVDIGQGEPVGLITYMRTDSTNISEQAIAETRDYIAKKHGEAFLPKSPRMFKKKVKGAQEAHEAIRPTSTKREPVALKAHLTADQFKLYDLIWKRMVSSQMAAAKFNNISVDIDAAASKQKYLLRATSSEMAFAGFLTLYSEGTDNDENGSRETPLPQLAEGEELDLAKLLPEQHFTKPPARYTEATLIKALEENGIGRPSTYAPTLSIIQERDYVKKEKGHFTPEEMGFIVTDLLRDHFPNIVDISFTARMEQRLDQIAEGKAEWIPTLNAFYGPFSEAVQTAFTEMPKMKPADKPTDEICEKCGSPMVIKHGRYGDFLSCSNYPECKNARSIQSELEAKCPKCGAQIVERRTKRKKVFYGCSSYPKCDFASWNKPIPIPCPECGGLLIPKSKVTAKCQKCDYQGNIEELEAMAQEEPALTI